MEFGQEPYEALQGSAKPVQRPCRNLVKGGLCQLPSHQKCIHPRMQLVRVKEAVIARFANHDGTMGTSQLVMEV
jgi:hypothetical protein